MPAAAQTTDTADSRQRWKCICAVFKGLMSGSFYSNVNSVINSAITQVVFWHIWSSNTTLQGSFSILITQLPAWMCLCSCEAAWGPGLRLKVVQKGKKSFFLWISSWFSSKNFSATAEVTAWGCGAALLEANACQAVPWEVFVATIFFLNYLRWQHCYLCRLDYLTNIFCIL